MKNQNRIQNPRTQWFLNLFSKFKTWCGTHRNTALAILLSSFVLTALTALLIGGTIAGWDIKGALSSPTAILVYAIAFVIAIFAAYRITTGRRGR